jgi:hypothetical protein
MTKVARHGGRKSADSMSFARQDHRVICDLLALVRPRRGEGEVVRVTDLSATGLGVRAYRELDEGSKVTVVLETTPPTHLSGHVVWCRAEKGRGGLAKHRAGIRLTHCGEAEDRKLRTLMAERLANDRLAEI